MKRLVYLIAVAVSLTAFAQASKPAQNAKPVPGVNWEGKVIQATGAGAPDMKAVNPAQARLGAERAAQMDAFRNLLAQVQGIQVSGGKTVGDMMASNDELKGRVSGTLRGFKVTAKRYFSDSGVEIDVEVPLSAISSAVSEAAAAPAASETVSGLAINTQGEKKNTGLVIDARGLKVSPALAPRVLGEDGKAFYTVEILSDEARKSKGVASYFKTLDQAQKSLLVGEKPVVVKATRADGSDLVLTAADIKKLTESNNSYLAEGRVAIVTN